MSATTRNRRLGIDSFIVCFYCNETFRTLTSLLNHCCSAEQKIALGCESLELDPDTFSNLEQEDSVSSETSFEKLSDTPEQEIPQAASNVSNVSEIEPDQSLLQTKPISVLQDIIEQASNETEKLQEPNLDALSSNSPTDTSEKLSKSNEDILINKVTEVSEKLSKPIEVILEKVTESATDASINLSKPIEDVLKNGTELSTDESEKLSKPIEDILIEVSASTTDASNKLSKQNVDVLRKVPELTTGGSDKPLPERNLNTLADVTEQEIHESKEKSAVSTSDMAQKITVEESKADESLVTAIPDLVSKVLQYYEKETKQDAPDSCCKSPSTEADFHFSHSPLSVLESNSPKSDETQLVKADNVSCNDNLTSEINYASKEWNSIQNESNGLKHNTREPVNQIVDTYDGSSRMESDSPMFSVVSSSESNVDSLGYGDDQAESCDSDASNTISLSEKKSDLLIHHYGHIEPHESNTEDCSEQLNSRNNVKSLLKETLNITKYNSVVIKPCYVKLQDIFKPLMNSKISPKKLFNYRKKYHVCDVCLKFFRKKVDLNMHYLTHTTKKPFVCSLCNKSFLKQNNLFAHHFAHTIKRPHVCSVCKKAFPKKSLLLRHKLTHTNLKPYKCEKCDKSYASKSSLSEHNLSHSDERPFICEICSASFANKRYLRKHYYSHDKQKFVCKFCFKVYRRRDHLQSHYNKHAKDKKYECNICCISFHLLQNLNKHLALKHNVEIPLLPESISTSRDYKITQNPVIQKIEICTKVETSEKTPEKSSVVPFNKNTNSMRRKSFIPKKYLQPD